MMVSSKWPRAGTGASEMPRQLVFWMMQRLVLCSMCLADDVGEPSLDLYTVGEGASLGLGVGPWVVEIFRAATSRRHGGVKHAAEHVVTYYRTHGNGNRK
jgi:hypothetical protein